MKSRLLGMAVLSFALSCAAQNPTPNSVPQTAPDNSAVAGQPAAVQLAPLNVALPGDGPATGAPITTNNDSRNAGGVSVYNPNVVPAQEPNTGFAGATNALIGNSTATGRSNSFSPGIQNYAGAQTSNAAEQTQTLADIARWYKTHKPARIRTFTNDELARVNPNAPVSVVGPNAEANQVESAEAVSPTTPTAPAAGTGAPTNASLPASDVEQSGAAEQQQQSAAQTAPEPQQQQSATQPQAPHAKPAPPKTESDMPKQLPQSGSALPVLMLGGFMALGGGVAFRKRR